MKLLRKNQFIVTMIAILIAVAGYLNYSEKLIPNIEKKTKKVSDSTYEDIYKDDTLISENGDILSMDIDLTSSEKNEERLGEKNKENESGETKNVEGENNESEDNKNEESEDDTDVPGTAVLTNSGVSIGDFAIQARMDREQIRSKNKENLQELINSDAISEEKKKEAVDAMVDIEKNTNLENEIETVLKAKGYEDIVVLLNNDSAEVIVNKNQIEDKDRAQIEQIITRKTDVKVSDIVITPIESN
jgi:stage III sporulation protein AH